MIGSFRRPSKSCQSTRPSRRGRGRLSWPQRHNDALWGILTQLEEYFGSAGGVNAYATPAGAQGFAPHYDDIDAFILQLEGEKRWRCYAPRSTAEALPRFSSPNFAQDELGELLGDFVLKPGDLLYITDPRWWWGGLRSVHSKALEVCEGDSVEMPSKLFASGGFDEGMDLIVEKVF